MRYISFFHEEKGIPLLGKVTPDGVIPLRGSLHDMLHLYQEPPAPYDELLAESDLRLMPAVPRPGKIICIGLNYRGHAAETGMEPPQTPMLFSKFNNALASHGQAVTVPSVTQKLDYEAELCVVMGRRAENVSESDALDYVLGYCNANDLSARDLQRRTSQFLLGKTLDHFLPLGPYLVTKDEIPDPQALSIRCWVNGELRQDSHTSDMVFSVAELISYISQHFALEAGDIIVTGTPSGVVAGQKDPVWLKAGDEITVEVENLGRLSNRLVEGN